VKGFCGGKASNFAIPIDFRCPYNTLSLPCECVILSYRKSSSSFSRGLIFTAKRFSKTPNLTYLAAKIPLGKFGFE